MNFFEAQRRSKRQTLKLYWLFGLAITFVILATNFATMIAIPAFFVDESMALEKELSSSEDNVPSLYKVISQGEWAMIRWDVLGIISLCLGSTFLGGSLIYSWQNKNISGGTIAMELGAQLISPEKLASLPDQEHLAQEKKDMASLKKRQLCNVVEEMSLAAAIPVLPVFVLQSGKAKTAINGFAAGTKPSDCVLVVTEGALMNLNRQEMQALIAHEISHIIHGDTLINIRMIGIIFGLTFLTSTGEFLLRLGRHSRRESEKNKGSSFAPLVLLGVQFWVIGQLGALLGRMIKASIARERELLADATAVQFTRDKTGLSNLLKKIQERKSQLDHPLVGKYAHMMIAPAEGTEVWGLNFESIFESKAFATHPTIKVRLSRLGAQDDHGVSRERPAQPPKNHEKKQTATHTFGLTALGMIAHGVAEDVRVKPLSSYSDTDLKTFARSPYLGRGLVAIILGVMDHGSRQEKLALIREFDQSLEPYLDRMWDAVSSMTKRHAIFPIDAFIELIEISAGALRSLSAVQKKKLIQVLVKLTMIDQKLSLREFFVTALVYHEFDIPMPWQRNDKARFGSQRTSKKLLSAEQILAAFTAAFDHWRLELTSSRTSPEITLEKQSEIRLQSFDVNDLIPAIETLGHGPQKLKIELLRTLALKIDSKNQINDDQFLGLEAFARLLGILVNVPMGRGMVHESLGLTKETRALANIGQKAA